jgi:hypothetical protein
MRSVGDGQDRLQPFRGGEHAVGLAAGTDPAVALPHRADEQRKPVEEVDGGPAAGVDQPRFGERGVDPLVGLLALDVREPQRLRTQGEVELADLLAFGQRGQRLDRKVHPACCHVHPPTRR